MRILLISPSQENVYGKKMMPNYPPLGLLYIGTVAKNAGHDVRLVDIDTEQIKDTTFDSIFREFNPEVVGLTCTTPIFKNALEWASRCKKLKRKITVVMGGVHATSDSREVIKEKSIDIVVVGEGESTARELFDVLSSKNKSLRKVKGILYKQNSKVVITEPRELIVNLDTIPFPDRSLLIHPERFYPIDAINLPAVGMMTSRGCPGGCTFCCARNVFTRRFRFRSTENLIEEIEMLVNKGVKEIHFLDDAFSIDKRRALDFCREVRKRKIKVSFQFINGLRADFVDREILLALRLMGVKTIGFGVETGNEDVLRRIKKGITLKTTRKAYRLSKKLGFETWAFLIFGLPGETEESARQTVEFTKELDPDFAKFLILKPYPGSEVYQELRANNLLLSTDYNQYGIYTSPVHNLPSFSSERMLYWQKRAFWEFYLRPAKIFSHLKRVRSLTQLKLLIIDSLFIFHIIFRRSKA